MWAMKTGERVTRDLEKKEHIEMMSSGSSAELAHDWSCNGERGGINQ